MDNRITEANRLLLPHGVMRCTEHNHDREEWRDFKSNLKNWKRSPCLCVEWWRPRRIVSTLSCEKSSASFPPTTRPPGENLVSCAAATTATIALIPSASRDLSSRPPLGRVVSNSTAVTPELIFSSHNVVSVNDVTAGCLPADNREAVCCWWWWVVSVFPRPPGKHCFNVTHSQASWQGDLANTKPHSGYSLIDTL